MSTDKHNTRKMSTIIAIVVSALFAAVGVAGYQRTDDIMQLMLFMGLAVIAFGIVKVLFIGINKLLDSMGDDKS